MNDQEIIRKVNAYQWKPWLERHFCPLITSFFMACNKPDVPKTIGAEPVNFDAVALQQGKWYSSEIIWKKAEAAAEEYLKTKTITQLSASLENFHKTSKKTILALVKDKEGNPTGQFRIISDILITATAYIYITHAFEDHFTRLLNKEVPKHIKDDVDRFIGDASFPGKKNAHVLMEEALRSGVELKKVAQEYGWIKARHTFSEPFSVEELQEIKNKLKPESPHIRPAIPKPLQPLFDEVQELVYFRTARTDVFFELFFLARPIIQKVGQLYGMNLDGAAQCPFETLLSGKPKKYNQFFTALSYQGSSVFSNEKILSNIVEESATEVKGIVAQKGIARGTVKVIKNVNELDKVREGDILVTQMTFPSFIVAMQKAAAFVTDEGGLTCHAAIVAREMKKPCIIATKVATKILKDGDKVEVDAEKGVVRKL